MKPATANPAPTGRIWALGSVTAGQHGRGCRGRRRAVSGDDVVVCWEWTGEGRLYLMVRIGEDRWNRVYMPAPWERADPCGPYRADLDADEFIEQLKADLEAGGARREGRMAFVRTGTYETKEEATKRFREESGGA